jgi:hypothetical protein
VASRSVLGAERAVSFARRLRGGRRRGGFSGAANLKWLRNTLNLSRWLRLEADARSERQMTGAQDILLRQTPLDPHRKRLTYCPMVR